MVKLLKIWCRGVPWGVVGAVGCLSYGNNIIWQIKIHFGALGYQKLLILVLWGVQTVIVNLKDTFDGKTT